MTFSISALVLARDPHIKPDSEVGGLIWVEGWYQGRYGKFHVIIFLSHILHWPFPCIDFYIAKKIFELTNYKNKFLRKLPLFFFFHFCFESGFKNIPNNVDLYNDVRNCLQNLSKTLTFEWKFLFDTTYTFELIIPFQVKLYSNMLKCVNFFEIRSYASSFLVLWQQSIYRLIFQTTAQIPEVEYGGKYGHMRANTDILYICPVFALKANNQHWLVAIIEHAKTNILQQNMW